MALRFEIDHAKGLVDTGPEKQAGLFIGLGQFRAGELAQKGNPLGKGRHQGLNLGPGGAIPGDLQLPVAL